MIISPGIRLNFNASSNRKPPNILSSRWRLDCRKCKWTMAVLYPKTPNWPLFPEQNIFNQPLVWPFDPLPRPQTHCLHSCHTLLALHEGNWRYKNYQPCLQRSRWVRLKSWGDRRSWTYFLGYMTHEGCLIDIEGKNTGMHYGFLWF